MAVPQQVQPPAVDLDEEGFLIQPEAWTENVARLLAQDAVQGELTEDHWKVINYFRQYYLQFKSVPPIKKLCRDTGCNFKQINKLFPCGLTKGPCRIAGLPRLAIRPGINYP